MLKRMFLALSLVLALGMVWAQGLETFDNMPETGGSYATGTFLGQDGSTWNYVQCRSDFDITGNAAMLGRNRDPQANLYSGTVSGGIGTLSFDYMQAYSTNVNLNVMVNDVVVGNVTSDAQQSVILNSGTITVNVPGNFVLKFINVNNSDGQVVIDNVTWTGYTPTSPVIVVTGTLAEFSTTTGTPSVAQSYTLSGLNLTAGIAITAPEGFQISTDGGTSYAGSGSVASDFNSLIYVRMTGSAAGSFSGDIVHSSTGATNVNQPVSGTVTDPVPEIIVTGTLTAFTTEVGTPSASQSYMLEGSLLTANIDVSAPGGFELSTDNAAFSGLLSLPASYNGPVYVRLTGTEEGEFSGNIAHVSAGASQVDQAVSGIVTGAVVPTLFMEENFAYEVGTTLVSNGWSAHSGVGNASPLVDATNLSYTNYPPNLGGSARTTGVTGEDVSKGFPEQTSGDVYGAFLLNITGLPSMTQDYFLHFGDANVPTGGTTFRGRLYAQRDDLNNVRFGISKYSTSTTIIQFTPYDYAYDTTYMMVLKYKIVPGTANDEVYLWINPTDTVNEPAHTLFIGTTDSGSDPSNIGSIAIRQSTNTPAAYYDGFRIANNWASLFSGEAPPTPEILVTGTLDPLYNIAGSPSDELVNYQLSGTNLVGPITVTAPTHFEVSSTGIDGWNTEIQVPSSFDGLIYVRLNSSEVGTHGGDIVHASPGADPVTIRVDGETFPPSVVWNVVNNMVPFAGEVGSPSDVQSYSLSATNATGNIIISVLDAAPFQISLTGTDGWTDAMSLAPSFNGNIYVQMLTTAAGSFAGTIEHVTADAPVYNVEVSGVVSPPAGDYAEDLFFSEYIEGGSNNKALEIFNGTGMPVDLSLYTVKLGSNGGDWGNSLTLSGTLAHNDVYVIANAGSNAAILAQADVTSTVTYYNGDDALGLFLGEDLIDVIGVYQTDPGTAWDVAGVTNATLNHTLIRKPTVVEGNLDWEASAGTNADNSEWIVQSQDYVDDLGVHTFTPGAQVTAMPVFSPDPVIYYDPINVSISCATAGATIRYTTDGSDPTQTYGTIYTDPLPVSVTTTFKAIAYAPGYSQSAISNATYTFPVNVSTVAELRNQPTGTNLYRLTGEAILSFQQSFRHQKYVQDATAGILIDDLPGLIGTIYNVGDGITGLTGTLAEYGGMMQLTPILDPGAATSTGVVLIPQQITLQELQMNFEAYESELVKVLDVTFSETGSFANGMMYTLNSGATSFPFRTTFYDVDYIGQPIPTTAQDIVGLPNSRVAEGNLFTARSLADFSEAAGYLPAPDLNISESGGTITLNWAAVAGASSYRVEHADDPYTGWTVLGTTAELFYSTAATSKKFYRVIAAQ